MGRRTNVGRYRHSVPGKKYAATLVRGSTRMRADRRKRGSPSPDPVVPCTRSATRQHNRSERSTTLAHEAVNDLDDGAIDRLNIALMRYGDSIGIRVAQPVPVAVLSLAAALAHPVSIASHMVQVVYVPEGHWCTVWIGLERNSPVYVVDTKRSALGEGMLKVRTMSTQSHPTSHRPLLT